MSQHNNTSQNPKCGECDAIKGMMANMSQFVETSTTLMRTINDRLNVGQPLATSSPLQLPPPIDNSRFNVSQRPPLNNSTLNKSSRSCKKCGDKKQKEKPKESCEICTCFDFLSSPRKELPSTLVDPNASKTDNTGADQTNANASKTDNTGADQTNANASRTDNTDADQTNADASVPDEDEPVIEEIPPPEESSPTENAPPPSGDDTPAAEEESPPQPDVSEGESPKALASTTGPGDTAEKSRSSIRQSTLRQSIQIKKASIAPGENLPCCCCPSTSAMVDTLKNKLSSAEKRLSLLQQLSSQTQAPDQTQDDEIACACDENPSEPEFEAEPEPEPETSCACDGEDGMSPEELRLQITQKRAELEKTKMELSVLESQERKTAGPQALYRQIMQDSNATNQSMNATSRNQPQSTSQMYTSGAPNRPWGVTSMADHLPGPRMPQRFNVTAPGKIPYSSFPPQGNFSASQQGFPQASMQMSQGIPPQSGRSFNQSNVSCSNRSSRIRPASPAPFRPQSFSLHNSTFNGSYGHPQMNSTRIPPQTPPPLQTSLPPLDGSYSLTESFWDRVGKDPGFLDTFSKLDKYKKNKNAAALSASQRLPVVFSKPEAAKYGLTKSFLNSVGIHSPVSVLPEGFSQLGSLSGGLPMNTMAGSYGGVPMNTMSGSYGGVPMNTMSGSYGQCGNATGRTFDTTAESSSCTPYDFRDILSESVFESTNEEPGCSNQTCQSDK